MGTVLEGLPERPLREGNSKTASFDDFGSITPYSARMAVSAHNGLPTVLRRNNISSNRESFAETGPIRGLA